MKLKISKETIYVMSFFLLISFTSIRLFLEAIFSYLGVPVIGKALFYIITCVCLLYSFTYFLKFVSFKWCIGFIVWIIYCWYCAKTTKLDSDAYSQQIVFIVVFGGVYFLMGQSAAGNSLMIKKFLYQVPTFLNIIGTLNYFLLGRNGLKFIEGVTADYSMEMSYANLTGAMISTVILLAGDLGNNAFVTKLHGIKQKHFIFIINLIISYILVLLGGSRGPIMTLLIVSLFSSIYSITKKKNTSTIILLALLAVMIFILLSSNIIVNSSMRFISMLASQNLLSLSGREHYIDITLQGISENKLFGLGVFRDRVFIYENFHRSYTLNSLGSYSHNFFLEILLQFGIILGSFFITVFLVRLIQSYRSQSKDTPEVYWLLVGIGFIPLLVSKSYTQSWEFYLLVGYLLGNSKAYGKMKFRKDNG